jgi:uncharacterized SAM-binding protein YcdF (DUF218 family)
MRAVEAPLRVVHPFEVRDAIVVLGAPVRRDGGLSRVLRERVSAAAELFVAGGAPRVVVTGGTTNGAPRSEAAAMAEALVAGGVPPAAIVVEDRSRTTAENATYTAELVDARRVWLVTHAFHARRAAHLFRRAGFDPSVWPVAGAPRLRWLAREYAAWAGLLLSR